MNNRPVRSVGLLHGLPQPIIAAFWLMAAASAALLPSCRALLAGGVA